MKQGRGRLTDRIKKKSKELLGYTISQAELRLMAYLQYAMVNNQEIKRIHTSDMDRKILEKWEDAKRIDRVLSFVTVTKGFWDAVCELVYLGYVDLD